MATTIEDPALLRDLVGVARCDGYHVHDDGLLRDAHDEATGSRALVNAANVIEATARLRRTG
jgi:hypothetical protein